MTRLEWLNQQIDKLSNQMIYFKLAMKERQMLVEYIKERDNLVTRQNGRPIQSVH